MRSLLTVADPQASQLGVPNAGGVEGPGGEFDEKECKPH